MMKKIFIVLIIFFLPSSVWAYPNEPDGFRNLKWGTSLDFFLQKYPNAQYVIPDKLHNNFLSDYIEYNVDSNNSTISGITIASPITYTFWNNKLIFVKINLSGNCIASTYANEEKILNKLRVLYGTYDFNNESGSILDRNKEWFKMYSWEGNATNIILMSDYYFSDSPYTSSLSLSLYSSQLLSTRNKLIQQKQQAEAKQGW